MNNKERFTKLAAGLTAAAMISSISLTGCDQIYATNPTPSITGEVTPGETTKTSTETTLPTEITSEPIIIPSTETVTESTTEIITETITTKPTTEATTVPTTETKSELEGVAAERLEFTKDLLNLYNESSKDSESAFNKITTFITREEIITYGETGEGLTVIKNKDGSPAIAMINCKDNVVSSFKTAIKEMEVYDPNYLKVLTSNGMRAFIVNRYAEGSSNFTFNKSGLVVWNATEEKLSESNVAFALKGSVETESFGIKMYQLGGEYTTYIGFMKELLSSDCWWNLYKKTGQDYCKSMSYDSYIQAEFHYNQYYAPVTFKDKKIQNLLKSVRDNNLATPFGGTWSEISTSIVDRPDWKGGEIA